MPRIKIKDLPKNQKVSPEELKKVLGGLLLDQIMNYQPPNIRIRQLGGIGGGRPIRKVGAIPEPIP